ncbi:MAG TPA: hypothetical protein VF669_12885 [Tepidisphaeraceae bacterium]|jgi:hypothetical protein
MAKSWLPTKESELLPFATNFSTRISATPLVYNCTSGDATTLAGLLTTYSNLVTLCNNPGTRTSVNLAGRDVAKAALVAELRLLYKKVRAGNLSADKLEELGLEPRDVKPSPVPAPSTKPLPQIIAVSGRTLSVRVSDASTPTKRARPANAAGLEIFSYVAPSATVENPPSDISAWKFEGLSTRTSFDVAFANNLAIGTRVWICCRWYSPRGEVGPVSETASAYVTGGVAQAA